MTIRGRPEVNQDRLGVLIVPGRSSGTTSWSPDLKTMGDINLMPGGTMF
jgi:hypothetical protein